MKEISKETIEKISETKLENGRKKILEGFIKNDIPTQSNTQLAIPSHRTREWISFEEFKTFISQGIPLQELCRKYSKHLMAFYSYLSKGKITLTKEQFEDQYNKGIPLDEIARANGIPREHITYLREYYGIKRKGATYQRRLKNEVPLSQEAKDIIVGSLLGDGHITPGGYFSEKHYEEQIDYLEWKASFLKPVLNQNSFSFYKYFDKRYRVYNSSFCLRTITHDLFIELRNLFYNKDKKKILPSNIGDLINELALSVWFMDDGNTDWMYRNGKKKYNNSLPQCKFCSESFSISENAILQSILLEKFGLSSTIRMKDPKNNKRPYLRLDCESSVKLHAIVTKFATKDMFYKINENEFLLKQSKVINKEELEKLFLQRHHIASENTTNL